MDLRYPSRASLAAHPVRTACLVTLVACLAFAAFGGTLAVSSLRHGLASLRDRLGADLIVAPQTARSTTDLERVLAGGVPSSFYMDRSFLAKVAARPGVSAVSPQYYLATVKAGCCSLPVQIIGIDPATDFTIQPWIARSYASDLGFRDIVAGCDITGAPGSTITFYGRPCTIVAKLDETGTALDSAVFCTAETVADLIAGSAEQGLSVLASTAADPAGVVSTIQVRVAADTTPTAVADDINLHVRGAYAVQTKAMTSGVASSMVGVSRVIAVLVAVVWVVAAAVLAAAFALVARQRVREFAVLRVLGAPRRALVRMVARETTAIVATGSLAGIVLAAAVLTVFAGAFEQALDLPFLLPTPLQALPWAVLALALSLAVGLLVAALATRRLVTIDPATTLREG